MGVKFQLNLPSIAGMYGNRIKKKAVLLLSEKAVAYTGTDIHSYNIFQSSFVQASPEEMYKTTRFLI